MPLYKKLKERIKEGAIGNTKMVQVNFGSNKGYDSTQRFFALEAAVSKYSTVVRIVFGISLKNVLANAVAYTPISNKAPPAASNAKYDSYDCRIFRDRCR